VDWNKNGLAQFSAAPTVVSGVIPGAWNAAQAKANAESFSVNIPKEFWDDLKKEKLIAANAPTPVKKKGITSDLTK